MCLCRYQCWNLLTADTTPYLQWMSSLKQMVKSSSMSSVTVKWGDIFIAMVLSLHSWKVCYSMQITLCADNQQKYKLPYKSLEPHAHLMMDLLELHCKIWDCLQTFGSEDWSHYKWEVHQYGYWKAESMKRQSLHSYFVSVKCRQYAH